MRSLCASRYVSGHRRGQACPYRATSIVNPRYGEPFLVCGYHAKGYRPEAIYPLDWSLARIRSWQLDNLAAVTAVQR